jgi:hypothetical protein
MDMGGYNYSLSGTLGTLLYLVVKLLIVVLAVVVVLGVITWIRDTLFKNDSSKIIRDIKSDPLLKAVSVITLAIIGIVFLFAIINSVLFTGMAGGMGGGIAHQGGYMGYNAAFGIAGILYLLIRVLMFILVISLVLAGLMYVKSLYESGKLNIFNTTNVTNENKSTIIGVDNNDKNK